MKLKHNIRRAVEAFSEIEHRRTLPVFDKPIKLPAFIAVIGGSHRKYNAQREAVRRAGIIHRWLYPHAMGSKLQDIAVHDTPQARALIVSIGARIPRKQTAPNLYEDSK